MLLGASLGAATFSGCDRGTAVVVRLSNVPPMATELRVLARPDGQPEKELERIPVGDRAGKGELTFGIRLPPGVKGGMLVSTAVLASSCLVASGSKSGEIKDDAPIEIALRAAPAPASMPCAPKQVIITDVQPPSVSTMGGEVTIHGFGFGAGATVTLSGLKTTVNGTPSGSEIRLTVDPIMDTGAAYRAVGRVQVKVTSGADSDERKDLLWLRARQLLFSADSYPAPKGQPRLVAADLRGDGFSDLINPGLGNDDGGLSLWRHSTNGTFGGPELLDMDANRTVHNGLLLADVDGDGKPDLVTADDAGKGVSVFVNNGGGGLRPAQRPTTAGAVTGTAPGLVALDVTGDQRPDLILHAELNGTKAFYQFQNLGGGNFKEAQPLALGLAVPGNKLCTLATVDTDRDQKPELIAACGGMGIEVLKQGAPGVFTRTTQPVPLATRGVSLLVPVDVDNDQDLDLVVADSAEGEPTDGEFLLGPPSGIVVLRNEGGAAPFPADKQARYVDKALTAIGAADFDRDGLPDLVVGLPGKIQVLRNKGGGLFESGVGDVKDLGAQRPFSLVTGHFDLDRRSSVADALPDLAVRDAVGGTIYVLLNESY